MCQECVEHDGWLDPEEVAKAIGAKEPQCQKCKIQLVECTSGKDLVVSNYKDADLEIYTGRLHIMACPKCKYLDETSVWFT